MSTLEFTDRTIPEYLRSMAQLKAQHNKSDKRTLESFILKHGKSYSTDDKSYIGGMPQQCYRNSARMAGRRKTLIYVEGYVTVCGVPISHAWNVNKDGIVRDYTLFDAGSEGHREYFGIPFQIKFVREIHKRSNWYGMLTYPNIITTIDADPKLMIKT